MTASRTENPVKPIEPAIKEREAEAHFQHGLQLEETGAPAEQAIAAYKKAIAANPYAAGALVNLGDAVLSDAQIPGGGEPLHTRYRSGSNECPRGGHRVTGGR